MNVFGQCFFYMVALTALAWPLGIYMARIYEGRWGLKSAERRIYRLCGVDENREMTWKSYAAAMLLFNLLGIAAVYLLQRFQAHLPLNPMKFPAVTADSSFNTAVSFATNTNWQGYGGETTMSYLTQMLGLTVQNFVSAASGMATLVAVIRGFVRRQAATLGNFWVDLTRSVIYVLLPLSFFLSLALVSEGVVQTFKPYRTVSLVQPYRDASGNTVTEQLIAVGPAASQVAIKQLGTNGGGFFNVNSAHPFENPTPFSNFLESLSILWIAAGLCFTFGEMVKDRRQGWAVFAAMTLIFTPCLAVTAAAEQAGNPVFASMGVDQSSSDIQPGGNMEGKEARFGIAQSAIWAAATTAASNGSVNSMHDSYTPLGGLMPLWLIQLGEVVYGGVGSGLYGMIAFVVIAVFAAGLMVGRTPEYLGKKIEAYEMKMASVIVLVPCATVLIGTAAAVATKAGTATIFNPGVHGFSEVLYAFSSAGNNNGSAFAGLGANNLFYNVALGISMFVARYWLAVPALAMAGSLARKKAVPASSGTLPTHTPLFVFFLVSIVLVVGALTFFPALSLGPIVEHLMLKGALLR